MIFIYLVFLLIHYFDTRHEPYFNLEVVQSLCIIVVGLLLLAYCLIAVAEVGYSCSISLVLSCRYPERFPSEVANDAMEWCQSKVSESRKLTLATVLVHTWPATVNDIHKAVSAV